MVHSLKTRNPAFNRHVHRKRRKTTTHAGTNNSLMENIYTKRKPKKTRMRPQDILGGRGKKGVVSM